MPHETCAVNVEDVTFPFSFIVILSFGFVDANSKLEVVNFIWPTGTVESENMTANNKNHLQNLDWPLVIDYMCNMRI